MSTPDRVTLKYLTEFRCVAGACRENCCTGLRVQLSEENHRKLEERSAKVPQLLPLFERHVKVTPEAERTSRVFAHIEPDAGQCPFLDTEWLCAIQRHAGEETLADPCSLFPRSVAEVGTRRELSATLACPETARLCLTTEGAVDSVTYEPTLMAREIVVRRHDAASADPYVALLDDVRQLCLDVVFLDGPSMATKVVALLDFAQRVEPTFHEGTTAFDSAAFSREVDALSQRLRLVESTPATADERVVLTLSSLFVARLGGTDNRRFNQLLRPALLEKADAPRDVVAATFSGGPRVLKPLPDLAALISRRGQALTPWRAKVDQYLHRAAVNSLVKDWYTQRPTLASALRRLVIRLAASRFALLLHPNLDGPLDATRLDEAAVDAFQIVAKNIEHVPTFMDLCERFLAEQSLDDAAGARALLTV